MPDNSASLPDDQQLVQRVRAGDDTAHIAFARRIEQYAQYQLQSLSVGTREDVLSHIQLKVFKEIATYDPSKGALKTWVNAVARNAVIDHLRSCRVAPVTVSLDDAVAYPAAMWDDVMRAYLCEIRSQVLGTIDAMENDLLRSYLVGKCVLLLDDALLARLFEVSEPTVRSNMRRALKAFYDLFRTRHPQYDHVLYKEFAKALSNGAVSVSESLLKRVRNDTARSALRHIVIDRFPIGKTAGALGLSTEQLIQKVREGLADLLIAGATQTLYQRAKGFTNSAKLDGEIASAEMLIRSALQK